jgi:hypothetical protein
MWRFVSLSSVLISIICLAGCGWFNTYATVQNLSSTPLMGAKWVLSESPAIIVEVGTIAGGSSQRTTLPSGFGESSLHFTAALDSKNIQVTCGYLESDGLYQAHVRVNPDGSATCEVTI